MEFLVVALVLLVAPVLFLIGAINLKKKEPVMRAVPGSIPASAGYPNAVPGDAPNGGYTALGFFFPIVGLILYLVWKAQTPLRARSAGKGALIGVIVEVGLTIISFVVIFILSATLGGY